MKKLLAIIFILFAVLTFRSAVNAQADAENKTITAGGKISQRQVDFQIRG